MSIEEPLQTPTVTLGELKGLAKCLAPQLSILALSPPGIGKTEAIQQAASEAGLKAHSLLGTQIAPEDVSGIPRLVGDRTVFCPPRILLPEGDEPIALLLDELPACSPDIQKAFYSLLLERRVGEHSLPRGSWVIAAGNRAEDRALVRTMSNALVNRVIILHVRADHREWLAWAEAAEIRREIRAFIGFMPEALSRPTPQTPTPFSTPRAWATLARALDRAESGGVLNDSVRRALASGLLSAEDAAVFCTVAEGALGGLLPAVEYICNPRLLPRADTARWFVLKRIRALVERGELRGVPRRTISRFLLALPREHRMALLVDLMDSWAELGGTTALCRTLDEIVEA